MKGQWGRLAGYFVGVLLVSIAVTFGLPLIGGGNWMPEAIAEEAGAIDTLSTWLAWLSVVIFAMVGALVIYCVQHFRVEPGDMSDGDHIHGDARMEIAWVIIPSVIVAVIALVSFKVLQEAETGLYDAKAAKEDGAATMQVDVRGFSFGWAFRYTEKDGTPMDGEDEPASELVLPVDEVVRFNVMSCSGSEALGRIAEQVRREHASHGDHNEYAEIKPGLCEREWDLTTPEQRSEAEEEAQQLIELREARADGDDLSEEQQTLLDEQPAYTGDRQYFDVNHAFWVPEARMKIDAIAGLRTYTQFSPERVTGPEDKYFVVCAELCGSGHNGMRTEMCVVEDATFEWWIGLDAEERRDATCTNLRLLTCFDDVGDDPAALVASMNELTSKDPDADCDKAEEAAA